MPFPGNGGAQAERSPPTRRPNGTGREKIKNIEKNPLELRFLIDFLIAFLLKFKYNKKADKTASKKSNLFKERKRRT